MINKHMKRRSTYSKSRRCFFRPQRDTFRWVKFKSLMLPNVKDMEQQELILLKEALTGSTTLKNNLNHLAKNAFIF